MKINLAYGKEGLLVDFPNDWNVQVVEPVFQAALADPSTALADALNHPIGTPPLRELVGPGDRVGIIVNDMTRATPNPAILNAILRHLAFVPPDQIRLLIALGTHRAMTPSELDVMLGEEISRRYTIIQNDAFDPATQVSLGRTSQGHEIRLSRALMECDVKILTGFIEPHFFAGYSGAGKAIMPGMASLDTILDNHCAANISHPNATWGQTWGNPIWEEVREVARKANATFLLNVTLNRDQAITGVFAGDLDLAHAEGVAFVRKTAMVAVDEPFDIVVTSNSGYPLDLNLYQTVKGMSAASQIVRPGGAILAVSACWDGIPDHGHFKELLESESSPAGLLQRILQPGFRVHDQWEAQVQAQVQQKAHVYLYSDHLSDAQIRAALLTPCRDI
ncbi:nickel-dependent lactate racemase, partial [bacterium]